MFKSLTLTAWATFSKLTLPLLDMYRKLCITKNKSLGTNNNILYLNSIYIF